MFVHLQCVAVAGPLQVTLVVLNRGSPLRLGRASSRRKRCSPVSTTVRVSRLSGSKCHPRGCTVGVPVALSTAGNAGGIDLRFTATSLPRCKPKQRSFASFYHSVCQLPELLKVPSSRFRCLARCPAAGRAELGAGEDGLTGRRGGTRAGGSRAARREPSWVWRAR